MQIQLFPLLVPTLQCSHVILCPVISRKGTRTRASTASAHVASSPVSEHKKYNQTLHQRTAFPLANKHSAGTLSSIVLSFRFRSIEFSKKRALPFFLAIELLTHRKCVASLSSRNVQA